MLLVIRKHSMCAAMTGLSVAMTGTGKLVMTQMADTSSMQGPLNLQRGTMPQTDLAIPNKKDMLRMTGIAAGSPTIYVVLVRPEDVTGLAALLSVLLLNMLYVPICKYVGSESGGHKIGSSE